MKPIWKWIIGTLTLLVVALAGISWYLSRNWKPLVEEQLQELIKSSTDSLYTLTYDELDMAIALGNLTLKNAVLRADTLVYAHMESAETAPDNLYDIEVKELKVKRFGILDILRNRTLSIRSITLTDPNIKLATKYHAYNDTLSTPKPKKSLYESVKNVFHAIHIGQVDIENAAFHYSKVGKDKQQTAFGLDSLRIQIADIQVDENSHTDTTRLYYTKRIEAFVPGFKHPLSTPSGDYTANFEALQVNTEAQTVLLTRASYKPTLEKAAFYKKYRKNFTRTDLYFDTLYLEKLDFKKLIEKQQTVAQRAYAKNGHVKLYGDKRFPKQPVNQIGRAPHQNLMRAKNKIHIDSVFIQQVDVVYGEMSQKYAREGEISFNRVTGSLSNVTNDSLALAKDQYMQANLSAHIMNKGQLRTQFRFDMLSKNGAHSYNGTLGRMNASEFNRILFPLLNVEIASGNIRGIRFNVSGTDYRSRGDFRFDYDNLKISIKADPNEGKSRSLKIVSFLVNQIIINDSNPDANEKYHTGKIDRRRVPEHTFFKNLWENLLEGIKQTAGISKEREQKWKERAEVTKNAVEATKETSHKTKGFFRGLFKKEKE